MITWETAKLMILSGALALGCAVEADAEGRPPMRVHTATETQPLDLVPAVIEYQGATVDIQQRTRVVSIESNGVPEHAVGRFPNSGNPHTITAQSYDFDVPKRPRVTGESTKLRNTLYFGVALNGVPFDPGAAEFWQGNPRSGWVYEALGGAVSLGLDENHAHVQPNGSYHYHGLPTGLLAALGWQSDNASPLIGYAADGFPIYAYTARVDGGIKSLESSYQLMSGSRPGGREPSGTYDGTFVQDYVYVAGSGDLDACNGTVLVTPEYPNGTYAYVLTEDFPVIPRCLSGKPDRSFAKSSR